MKLKSSETVLIGILAILVISFFIFTGTNDETHVSGWQALSIATHHFWYLAGCTLGVMVLVGLIWYIEHTGVFNPLAIFIAGAIILGLFLIFPVNIKNDPVSSGITQAELNSLR